MDAVEFTHGVSQVQVSFISNRINTQEPVEVSTERLVLFETENELSSQELELVASLCTDLTLLSPADNNINQGQVNLNQPLSFAWRSYHSDEKKSQLGELMLSKDLTSHCILRVNFLQKDIKEATDLVFSFVNQGADTSHSTSDPKNAIEESLIIVNTELSGFVNQPTEHRNLVAVDQQRSIKIGVKALRKSAIAISDSEFQHESCRITLEGDKLIALTQDGTLDQAFAIDANRTMNIETIETTSSATKQLSQCKNFMTDINTNTLKTSTSCENYLEVINLAADESCAFNIEAVNPEDPGNQITIFKQMPGYKPPYGDITSDTEVASAAEAYGAIPKDAIDLIDFDGVELVNFNTAQESHLKNGLALWLAQSPATYRDYFDNHINKMTYVGTEDICNGGNAIAFAPLNSTEFFWCESSNFSEAALDVDIGGPSAAVNIAVTAYHEVLHIHSYDHDFARQDYNPARKVLRDQLL